MLWFEGSQEHRQAIVLADAKGGANGHIEMPNPLVQKLLGKKPTAPKGGSGVEILTKPSIQSLGFLVTCRVDGHSFDRTLVVPSRRHSCR